MRSSVTLLLLFFVTLAGCSDRPMPTAAVSAADEAAVAGKMESADDATARVVALVDAANARLAAEGRDVRIGYPWLFRIGQGVDPYARLRTGLRWTHPTLTYVLDASDYTADVSAAEVEQALVNAYETWNGVGGTSIRVERASDNGENIDILDGTFDGEGNCISLLDFSSPYLALPPAGDIVVGGWLDAAYFVECLGSESIIGATFTVFGPDANGDKYGDIVLVEQFYNDGYAWTTTEATYLDFDAPMDVETIAVHENGHALGLDHFGGPVRYQPYQLQPNGKVFNPEAVMNPFYIGGEKRSLYTTDVAGLKTLYVGIAY